MATDSVVNKHRSAEVLLVEDNHGDVLLTKRAFKEGKIANNLTVAMSGEEALLALRREGGDAIAPDLILLDLNLPQMSGKEVLKAIKTDPKLKHIPVVVLSSSKADQDVIKSYNLHANGYVVKPVSLACFQEVVQKMEQFWFTLVVQSDSTDIKESVA